LSTTLVTPRIETLRRQGQSGSPEFRQLHGRSMQFYVSEAVLLLLAGVALRQAIAHNTATAPRVPTREIAPDTAAA